MRHLGIWSAAGLALLSGTLVSVPGCRSSPESRPAESGDTVVITGRVELPPVHPMMLFPRRIHGREHIHTGMNQGLDERICGYLDKQQPRHVYGLKEQDKLKLGSLLRLRVVPWANSGGAAAKEGTVEDDGRFRVEVPRSSSGYYLTVTGGQAKLKARVLPDMLRTGRIDGIVVSLVSTALTELAEGLGREGRIRPDQALKEALGGRVKEFVDKLGDMLTYGLWAAHWAKAQKTKPYYKFQACTAEDRDPACYRRGDKVPYALMSAAQLPADATRWTPAKETRPLSDQYAAPGVRFAAYRPAGERGASATSGMAAPPVPVEEQAGGFILVRPVGSAGGVDVVFSQGVRAVGMTIQNGTTHADTARAFPRRGFRFTPMDRYGAPIEEYRWYTNQGPGGAGFYGAASDTPIHRVRVEVRSPAPFTIGDLRWSATYPEAVAGELGWVASGNWRLVDGGDENRKFIHPYYAGYEEHFGDQFYNLRELAADSSRGRYWHVPYGPTATPEGSTLTSPAFTLSNLDLDEDDRKGFSSWIIGITSQTQRVNLTSLGADKKIYNYYTTANPLCRIGGIDFLFGNTPFPKPKLMPGCNEKSLSDKYVAGMDTHWGHFHFRANIDVPEKAQWENVTSGPDRTERYIEYSTDNGATWRNLWWWPDQSHHGVNGVWWKNHGHGMYDSDMFGNDWNGNGKRGTDFDKDGVDDYIAPVDNNGNGVIDASPNGDDAREWDTEWYMEYVPPSQWRDVDGDGYLDSDIEGVSVRYRLRFVGPSRPARCGTKECFGWKIDDFAINNDNPRVGYYTSFDGSYDANLR
jgi:hypothetical protein